MEANLKGADQAHKSAARLEMFKATVAFEHAAIRPLFLLNGGAALATLTFLGSIWQPGGTEAVIQRAGTPLGGFSAGLILAALTAFLGYLSQQRFYQSGGVPERMEGTTPAKLVQSGHRYRLLAYLCAGLSLACFVAGLWGGLYILQA